MASVLVLHLQSRTGTDYRVRPKYHFFYAMAFSRSDETLKLDEVITVVLELLFSVYPYLHVR